jgi:hypothetical protein
MPESSGSRALWHPPFWLCFLVESAFRTSAPVILSGETFDEGFYLAKIKWLEFVNVDSANQQRY